MATVPETTAFDHALRPLLQLVLPEKSEAVLNYRPDPALQARIEALAERARNRCEYC
jgi:hypothetical protein